MKGCATASGLIYFMRRADGVGPVKIGCSKWPEQRLQALQIWSPEPLEIVAAVAGTFADETRLHREFAEHRLHGEWFEATPRVLSAIARIVATGQLPPPRADDRVVRIMGAFEAGQTYEQIGADFGVSRQRIEQIVRKAGGTKRGRGRRKRAPVWEALAQVRSLAARGCSCGEIAEAINDSRQNVYNACAESGITLQRPKGRVSQRVAEEAFEVAAAYRAGVSTYEIATKCGRKQPEIYRLLRVAGVRPNRQRKAGPLPLDEIVRAYRQGATLTELATLHACHARTIKCQLAKIGQLRSPAESEALRVSRVRAANTRRAAA